MLKVVVFDSGWGGEMFADYLEERVPVVEVTRVIDWRNAPYSRRNRTEICILTERALKPFLCAVDVIVLASYASSVAALSYLRWKYPSQKFVGFEPWLSELVKDEHPRRIVALATGIVEQSAGFQDELGRLSQKQVEVVRPECSKWIGKVDDGEMSEPALREALGPAATVPVDAVLLYSTGFTDLKPALRNIFGQKTLILDDFQRVLRHTCTAIELRGGDGTHYKKSRDYRFHLTTSSVGLTSNAY